ncbi:hypothetical protein Tco_0619687 [Tanacetum coccineum]
MEGAHQRAHAIGGGILHAVETSDTVCCTKGVIRGGDVVTNLDYTVALLIWRTVMGHTALGGGGVLLRAFMEVWGWFEWCHDVVWADDGKTVMVGWLRWSDLHGGGVAGRLGDRIVFYGDTVYCIRKGFTEIHGGDGWDVLSVYDVPEDGVFDSATLQIMGAFTHQREERRETVAVREAKYKAKMEQYCHTPRRGLDGIRVRGRKRGEGSGGDTRLVKMVVTAVMMVLVASATSEDSGGCAAMAVVVVGSGGDRCGVCGDGYGGRRVELEVRRLEVVEVTMGCGVWGVRCGGGR